MSLLLLCHFHFSLTTFDNNIRHELLISNLWTSTQTHANQPFVTLELREKRFRSHKCFYCGSSGHFLANCPIWPKKCLPVNSGIQFETLSVFTSFTLFNLVTHSIHALIDSRAGQNLVDNELAKRFHLFLLLPLQTFPWFSVTWLQKHNPLTCQVMGLLAVFCLIKKTSQTQKPSGTHKSAACITNIHYCFNLAFEPFHCATIFTKLDLCNYYDNHYTPGTHSI